MFDKCILKCYFDCMSDRFEDLFEQCMKVTDELIKAAGEDKEKKRKALAKKIKIYRTGKGLTQDELAKELGVTKMEVIRWESAKNMPSQLALHRLKERGVI